MTMRIQAALDYDLDLNDAYRIIDQTKDSVGVFEVGTPFMRNNGGLEAVKAVRARYPQLVIYADTKICPPEKDNSDGTHASRALLPGTPYEIAVNAFRAGADIVTVMGFSPDDIIEEVLRAGRDCGGEVLIDLVDIEDIVAFAQKWDARCDYLSVNTLYVNQRPEDVPNYYKPLEDLKLITPYLKHAKGSIQGGVTLDNIGDIATYRPSLICIGRGIYAAADPGAAARAFRAILDAAQ